MKQTAVEWLQNELFTEEYMRNNLFEIFQQAKKMEKQQIIDFGVWYIGMEQEKVKKAFEQFKKKQNDSSRI